jgi:serine/threonine protein kinase
MDAKDRMNMNKIICPNCLKNVKEQELCEFCDSVLMLNERYYLLKILGKNVGVTYQASDKKNKNRVIIKELSIKKVKNWKDEELFKREAETLLSIDHDEIPDFIDYFEVSIGNKIKYYTVMEFIHGDTLAKRMDVINYSEYKVIGVMKEIAKILDYLHNLTPAVVHRDIKPTNIVKRKKDGKYVLIDFGSVVDALKPGGDSTVAGTFGYMAPEQFMGKASVKSDYYSLGIVALELLTKKSPKDFIKGVKLDWSEAIISDYMRDVLSLLLAENPDDRIGSFKELINILEEFEPKNEELILDSKQDLKNFKKMYKELKEIDEIKNKYSMFTNLLGLIAGGSIIGIFAQFYLFPSIFLLISSIIGLLSFEKLNKKRKYSFLPEYFSKLTEKEIIFLEIILIKDSKSFTLNKKDFYKLYNDAVSLKQLDINILMKYNKAYKGSKEFTNLLKDT